MSNTAYRLPTESTVSQKGTLSRAWGSLGPLVAGERKDIVIAMTAMVCSSLATLMSPMVIGMAVDKYMTHGNITGVIWAGLLLLVLYMFGFFAGYTQIRRMGGVGRRILFRLRNELFEKIQELPIAFFNDNKTGDLISRINNDTDKLNQFFSQALMQFVGNAFMMLGAGIFLLVLNWRLGLATLVPALGVLVVTQLISGWVKTKSRASLQSLGAMSAEIQESLDNFKVIVAFNRLDYFRTKFKEANERNYGASVSAGIASNVFNPIYSLASNLGQVIVLAYGIYLILQGQLTVGLLIGYVLYVLSFYNPLRQLATVWSSLQLALASLDRIQDVLVLSSNMPVIQGAHQETPHLLSFENISFGYVKEKNILKHVNLNLEKGKTYALVGPTGGGKTTTASLMARLYDPTHGTVFLKGKDMRAYTPEQRTKVIGFILQEPFLFSGTIRENILYGNEKYQNMNDAELIAALNHAHLHKLITRFENGLDTQVSATGMGGMSLGQKQLVAFMRAVLREPELLILDEATANIDTVTEALLQETLDLLPKSTTKVIIAHRLNTIENADEIFFVNGGAVTEAGSFDHAVEMLLHGKRQS